MGILRVLIWGVCLNLLSIAHADTIVLKSGQSVTGKVVEKTDKYTKMDVEGVEVTYYADEIKGAEAPVKAADLSGDGSNDQDKLIQEVLEAGGIKKQIEDLPGIFISSMMASCERKNTAEACSMVKEAAARSFKARDFQHSVVDALELNFDKDRLSSMLQFFTSPLSRKITQEELLSESPQAMPEKNEFAKQLLANPPSEQRLALFERSDKAVHSTDLAVEISSLIAMQIYEAVKKATPGQSSNDDAASEMQMELQLRVSLREPMKKSSRLSFLFDYRHVSDEELNEQISFEETQTGRWFTRITNKAFVDAMSQAGKKMAATMVSLAKQRSDAIQAQFKSLTNEELYKQAKDLLDGHSGRADDVQNAFLRLTVLAQRDPHFAKTYVGLARIIIRSGYTNDPRTVSLALQYIDKAIMLDPHLEEAYRFGGYFEVYAGDLAKAKEMSAKARAIEPGLLLEDLLDGYIAYTEKRYADAVTLDQTALAKAKTDQDRWLVDGQLVEAYKQNSQKQEAKDTYVQMIALRPDDVWAKGDYAAYLSFCGDWDQAIEWAQKAIAERDYPAAHQALADAYYRKGYDLYWKKQQYNQGGPYFEKAYAEDPTIKGINYSLADYYRSINRLQDAVDAYRREITNDPTNQNAQQELDRTLSAMGGAK